MIRVNSRRCLLYRQPFLLCRSDKEVNEATPLRAQPYMTSTALNCDTYCSFAKAGATASAFMSVSGSVCRRGVSGSYQRGFRETSCFEFLLNSVDTFRYSLKSDKSNRHIKGRPTYIVVTGVYYGDSVYYEVRPSALNTFDRLNISPAPCHGLGLQICGDLIRRQVFDLNAVVGLWNTC